jgi:hypothetical protein
MTELVAQMNSTDGASPALWWLGHSGFRDPATLTAMLNASPRANVVLPKSTAEYASSISISYGHITTTDSNLRVEYLGPGVFGALAHSELNWMSLGGHPHLGYLISVRAPFYHGRRLPQVRGHRRAVCVRKT